MVYIVSEIDGDPLPDGAPAGVEVGRHYVTAEGYRVEREAKGRYREIFTKEIITSGDPGAVRLRRCRTIASSKSGPTCMRRIPR